MVNWKHLIIFSLATVALAACAPAVTIPTATVAPTKEPVPTQTAPSPTATEVVDYCLDCHSNQEQLVALAKPEVKAESESKGVG